MPADVAAARVFLLDRAERGRRGEQRRDPVPRYDPPERAGIGGADRLALVDDRRVAVQQGRVADVAVADHPADVGGRPEDLARIHVVDVLHRPLQRHGMAAVVAHDALGLAGRARGVEDVERVGRGDRHAVGRLRAGERLVPVEIAAADQLGAGLRPGQDDAALGPVRGERDRAVQERLVGDHPAGLDAAGRRDHELGPGVVDPGRELGCCEAAEHDRMHSTDPRAAEHRDQGFRHHRHVDDDPVAVADALPAQHPGEARDLALQLPERQRPDRIRDRAVVDDRDLRAAPALDVAVDRVPAGVEAAAREPAIERRPAVVEDPVPAPVPLEGFRSLGPEAIRIVAGARVARLIVAAHAVPPPWLAVRRAL